MTFLTFGFVSSDKAAFDLFRDNAILGAVFHRRTSLMPSNSKTSNTDAQAPTPPGIQEPSILTREDGAAIAYHQTSGKSPGIVFLPGFMSDMTGSKAIALEDHCKKLGHGFLRFDYTGHGQSSGVFTDGTIGSWTADTIHADAFLHDVFMNIQQSTAGEYLLKLVFQ